MPVCYSGRTESFPPTQPNTPAASSPSTFSRKYYYVYYFYSGLISIVLEPATPVPQERPAPVSPLATYKRLGKRKRGQIEVDPFLIDAAPKRKRPITEQFDLLMKLDGFTGNPGLTTTQLKALLTRCECGLTMTKRVYDEHDCMLSDAAHEVIDLTTLSD